VLLDAAYQDAVHAAGVPMPEVVRDPQGEVLRELEDGTVVRVYTWVEVGERDRSLDPVLVGRTVAAIHLVDVPDDGPQHPWHTEPVGGPQWRELADRSLAAGAPFGPALAALVPELTALEELLVPAGPLRRCHCDLWADNVLPSGPGLVVLDWENSGPADPVGELPMVMLDFGRHDPHRMRQLYAAYVAAGGPARITGAGDCSMLIATLGHIVEIGVTLWLNGTDPRARAADAAWVAEAVDEPLTRRLVDTIVAAAQGVTLPAP
jgi:aminoglycoside phosphotransferase (APT) family kinase protein